MLDKYLLAFLGLLPISKTESAQKYVPWLKKKITSVLKSLFDLKEIKDKNSSIKALAYQLYENNGVIKRDKVSEYLKNLDQTNRKILRDLGVRFGRYHIFLFKLFSYLKKKSTLSNKSNKIGNLSGKSSKSMSSKKIN